MNEFVGCMYDMALSGCPVTNMLFPDGSLVMAVEGCPVETLIYFCTEACPWMATQDACYNTEIPA